MATFKEDIPVGVRVNAIPGLIPEYHVMAAAVDANYEYYGNWTLLTWQQKAKIVAYYFAHMLVERHVQEAVSQEMQKRAKRNAARSARKRKG
jgi:hypothetical protein